MGGGVGGWGLRGGGEECGDGCVCVGVMAGFEVQVWWEGGHIQIPSTYMAPQSPNTAVLILLWRCGDGCVGSLVVLSPVNIYQLQVIRRGLSAERIPVQKFSWNPRLYREATRATH